MMKDENKTKVELIKELKFLREEREKGVFKDITKLKQAEQVIRESESRFKELFNHMSSGVAVYEAKDNGKDFIIKDFNRAAEKIDKVNKEDIIGESVLKVFPGVKDFGLFKVFQEVYKTGKPQHHPISFYKDQRITGWRENHVYKLSSGEIVAVYDDITERKQAEDAKHREELLSKSIVDNMPAGIAFLDNDFVLRWFNRTYAELIQTYTPYTGEQTLGMSYFDYAVGSRSQVEEWFQKVRDTGQVDTRYGFELVLKKDGLKKTTYWDTSVAPVLDVDGKVKGILILTQDVTVRKQAESELQIERDKLTAILGSMADGVYIANKDHDIQYVNPVLKETFGSPEGKKCHEYFYDSADPCTFCKNEEVFAGKTVRWEWTSPKYGKTYDLIDTPIKNADGSISKLEIFRDITERKQVEENIKNIKDELQIILDSVPALIFYKDTEGRIVRANKTLADALKIPVKGIVGKTTEELFSKEQAKAMRKDDKEVIISGKPKRNIIQPYDTPEGTRWAITDKMPYKDKEGKVAGVIAFAKDITVQRKSEQELKQTYQRLKKTMDATIDTMSKIIEAKDPYTSGHQHRVCQLAVPLARELGLAKDKIEGVRIASLIHDIGKIGLPTEILSKPTTLIEIEFSLIKNHSQIGYDILKSIDFSYPIERIVLQHHERLNGSGYPNNLKGDKILLEAKIIGVADVVEAMSSFRPYRPALGIDKALEEISKNKGILYNPEVVDACLKLFKEKGFKFE